jgi:glycosyltransferase involved in cell wall biosynthesis
MLRPYKGIERLIHAWHQTASPRTHDTLVIAGQPLRPEFSAHLTDEARKCDSIQIRSDFVPPERIPLFFSAADVVVLPFDKVLTSGSLLLAMSYGKPIIAPRLGAITETVGDADDLLYDPFDRDGLRTSLERGSGWPLHALGSKTQRACESLGWNGIAESTCRAYLEAGNSSNEYRRPR